GINQILELQSQWDPGNYRRIRRFSNIRLAHIWNDDHFWNCNVAVVRTINLNVLLAMLVYL
ncbi:MAG: hypothetical protein QOB17_09965, partial [Nitrososphaeraceae archaeon]|nr:hypothetical protein [Nitrososphaeraceae archaeon]